MQPDALVFATEPLPSEAGESWVWTPASGLTKALPEEFSAVAGWEAMATLAEAHPVDAMKLAPVLAALQGGLGADYTVFADRISDLGSGDLTAGGYLGQACLKLTCDADWAFLYLHAATEGVFAAWAVTCEDGHISGLRTPPFGPPKRWRLCKARWAADEGVGPLRP